jgi:hypothetical protein
MSVRSKVLIASVNMRKRNYVTHSLLNLNETAHLLRIQEPWYNTIGTARNDNAHQGVLVLGGAVSPKWELIYPGLTEGQLLKVLAYALKPSLQTTKVPRFSVVPRLDVCSHPTLQVLDVVFEDDETWRVINFYHNIQDNTSLQALLSLDIDALMPTLIVGDFNAHSQTWAPPTPGATRDRHAARIEEWAAHNLLVLANTPGDYTKGREPRAKLSPRPRLVQ